MKVKAVLPLRLVQLRGCADASDISTLHECYTREIWRERGLPARAALAAWFALWWPISNLSMLVFCTAFNGPTIRRRTGKSMWRQVAEEIDVAVRHSIAPPWYYIFDLWDVDKRAQADRYLNRYETKRGIYSLLKKYLGGGPNGLGDKLEFHEICERRRIPTPALVLVMDRGRVTRGDADLPAADLFVKPRKGRGGWGAECWEYQGRGRYRSLEGRECTGDELLARIARRSRWQPQLVQRRLVNHPDIADLGAGELDTARMMTVLNEAGAYEFTHAVFRTAIRLHSPVDNFHAGGIGAPVDPRTGVLGRAMGGGLRGVPGYSDQAACDTHPVTGARITGRRVPFWQEAVELVERAHRSFPSVPVVGWDVAFTPEGPVLIEGNSAPDLDIIQRCYERPLGGRAWRRRWRST